MIEELLPYQVASVAVLGDDPPDRLFPQEAAQLGRAVESRIREFTVARACARQALSKLGLPPSPILSGSRREPLWPPGVVGSITHCGGYHAAAVALQRDVLTVGIDAEVHEKLPEGVFEEVSIELERTRLAELPSGFHWDRILFSAKESVYKAWFPLTGRWLDFEDAVVTFEPESRTFHAQLVVAPPSVLGRDLRGFDGRFLIRDGLVLTAIAESR